MSGKEGQDIRDDIQEYISACGILPDLRPGERISACYRTDCKKFHPKCPMIGYREKI